MEIKKIDWNNIHESNTVKRILVGIALLVSVLFVLFIGITLGERQARFKNQFDDNFERNFIGSRGGMMGGFGGGMMRTHGAVGEIVSINLPEIITSGPENLEKTVLINASTTIRKFQENIKSSDLKVGDFIVVLGSPNNQGQIDARLIRIMPSPYEQ